jgi:putative transposase
MSTAFQRKNIRLPRQNYLGCSFCFATLCFEQRAAFASNPAIAHWLIDTLNKHAARRSFRIHAYCLMPDHLHFLAQGADPASDVLPFVGAFKQETGYVFSKRTGKRLWQSKWYDHLLRTIESVEAVCWYIWMNPLRKGICDHPSNYPFLGSFSECGSRLDHPATHPTWQPPWKVPG